MFKFQHFLHKRKYNNMKNQILRDILHIGKGFQKILLTTIITYFKSVKYVRKNAIDKNNKTE